MHSKSSSQINSNSFFFVDNPGPFATMAVLPAVVTNTLLFLGLQTFHLELQEMDKGTNPAYSLALVITFVWLEVLIHWKAVWSCATRDSGEQSVMTRLVRLMLVLFADSLVSVRKVSWLMFTDTAFIHCYHRTEGAIKLDNQL